jgi:hypothetical protein
MSDLERGLRELRDRVAGSIKETEMPAGLSRRVRVRRAITGAMGVFACGAIVLAIVVGVGAFASQDRQDPPPIGPAPEKSTDRLEKRNTCKGLGDAGGSLAGFRVTGKQLRGDVDGDDRSDRVSLRADKQRPKACRHVLVVETANDAILSAVVKPLGWPSADPRLLLLAEIDGRTGLEPVVAMSPGAVFRPGEVYTFMDPTLARMKLAGGRLFPFYDEFPTGVDCTQTPGQIVVTQSQFAPG